MKAHCEVGWFWEFGAFARPPSWSLVVTHIFKANESDGQFFKKKIKMKVGFIWMVISWLKT
jgi:hypothetical protein